jgi:hypothetical protein
LAWKLPLTRSRGSRRNAVSPNSTAITILDSQARQPSAVAETELLLMISRIRSATTGRPRDIAWTLPLHGSQERRRLGWAVTLAGVAMMLAGGAAGLLGGL